MQNDANLSIPTPKRAPWNKGRLIGAKPRLQQKHLWAIRGMLHPLQDDDGTLFYQDAEAVLARLPHRGVPMILREIKTRRGVACKPYSYSGFEKIVQQLRKKIDGVSPHFTLDACRHGGMTELEEAALTEGQGRALSGHKTAQAYRGYAKKTFDRALSATRKRHAHRLANAQSTSVQNDGQMSVQNENLAVKATGAK